MTKISESEEARSSELAVSSEMFSVSQERCLDPRDRLIYHYCSAETLLTILKKKTLRFSEAKSLNDGEEVVWGARQIRVAIGRLRDRDEVPSNMPPIPKKFIDWFLRTWETESQEYRHFLSCFSTVGDSLSQWRAYADDAKGFSVGFCVGDIDVPANFYQVMYEVEEQQSDIMKNIAVMINSFHDDKDYCRYQGLEDIHYLFILASAYKNPAFIDEREVRGIHMVGATVANSESRTLEYLGGRVADRLVPDAELDYRVARGKLIPYVDFPFQLESECAIREIWLGPRCETPVEDFKTFLHTLGYSHVLVRTAGSRYR